MVTVLASLYLGLLLLASLPVAKMWLANRTAAALSEAIGSKVNIESVTLNLFNSLSIEGVAIHDQRQHEMVHVNRLDAAFDLLPLLNGRLSINNIKVLKAHATLYKTTSDAPPNYQFIIDSLAPKPDGQKKIEVDLHSVFVSDLSLTYDVQDQPRTTSVADPNHLDVERLRASLIFHNTQSEDLDVRIRNLSLKMRSGAEITKLQAQIRTTDKGASYELELKNLTAHIGNVDAEIYDTQMRLAMPQSQQPLAQALYYLQLNSKVRMDGDTYEATVKVTNNREASIRPLHTTINISDRGKTKVWADAASSHSITDDVVADVEVHIARSEAEALLAAMKVDMPDHPLLTSLETLDHKGHLEHINHKDIFRGSTQTNLWDMTEDIELRGTTADYHLDIASLQLPETILDKALTIGDATIYGTLTTPLPLAQADSMALSKMLSHESSSINCEASVAALTYGQIALDNITAQLEKAGNTIKADVSITDTKARLTARGTINDLASSPSTHVEASIDHLNASLLSLRSAPLESISASSLTADASSATDFSVRMSDYAITYTDGATDTWNALSLTCSTDSDGISTYTIDGDSLTGELVTNISLAEMASSVQAQLTMRMPSLIPSVSRPTQAVPAHEPKATAQQPRLAALHLTTSGHQRLLSHLGYDIDLTSPLEIHGRLSPATNHFTLTASTANMLVNNSPYKSASLYVDNKNDSLVGSVMLTKDFSDMPVRIESHFSAADDTFSNELLWKAQDNTNTSGSLRTLTALSKEGNHLNVDTRVLPTNFYISDTLWQISRARLTFADNAISIKNLRISRQDQYIDIEADMSDTLRNTLIRLNDIEVGYLLSLTNFDPVEFSGRATGTISNLTGSKNLKADLSVSRFCFNKAPLGQLEARALYDADSHRLNFDAKAQDTSQDSTIIKGEIGLADNTLDIDISSERTNLQFLNRYVGRFISDLKGTTSGRFRLFGDFSNVNMEADERINYLQFRPDMLGVLYTFENDSVHIRPDTVDLSGMTIHDPYGNTAQLTGSLNHHNISKFDYSFGFLLHNLQVINWSESPTRQFWGNIFTSGDLSLSGTFSRVNINGQLTSASDEHSVLYYSSEASGGGEGEKNYIHFVTPEQKYSTVSNADANLTQSFKDTSTDVYMNLRYNVSPTTTLNIITDPYTRDYMSLNGTGPLRISYYNKGRFELNGLYSISGGSYKLTIKDIIRKDFTIQPEGYIRFNGNLADGDLNIQGIHKVNSVSLSDLNVGAAKSYSSIGGDCILNFTGKTSAPKVSFDLDFPNANSDENQIIKNIILTEEDKNMQVVYLLSIGRFYTYNYDTFDSNGQSQSTVAMTSFLASTLSGQLSNLLQDAFHLQNWNFGTTLAAGRQGLDDMEVQGNLSGRMFNNRLIFNGNFGYRNDITTYSNNFVGDFNLQWLLNKAGTISLKAYSETNDRYFTKSSLTTQGGGILFQKDFNLLREFFRTRKKDEPN